MTNHQTLPAGLLGSDNAIISPAQAGNRLLRMLATWQRRSVQRRRLAEMPDRLLRDIGMGREQARIEAGKPFWQS